MKILEASIGGLEISFRRPLKTALFDFQKLKSIILKLNTGSIVGFGEASPTLAVTGDTPNTVKALLEELAVKVLEGADPFTLNVAKSLGKIPYNGSVKAAIDMALHDLMGKFYRVPVFALLGGSSRRLETDVTISLGKLEEMCREAEYWVGEGFKTLKVKLGSSVEEDLQKIKGIWECVGGSARLRVDLNQAYTRYSTIKFASKVASLDVEFIEQPLPAWDLRGLAQVRRITGFPIAVDESVHTSRDLLKILDYEAADIVNIKLMKSGGLREGLNIAAIAEAAGIECMIGCMAETRLSITAAVHLACAAPNIRYVDLDSPLFLEEDPIVGGIEYDGPYIEPGRGYGLGVMEIKY
ncbi:MAG: dipeptide epimerase [Candidatus Bathyarchaeia archaeon]|nr:dipeptide epimerase [Candidatus Bathyarchaeota archaeon]